MRSAADLEDASDKHPVTSGSIVPARELLGDMLLEANQPAEALAEYERSLNSAPIVFTGWPALPPIAIGSGDLHQLLAVSGCRRRSALRWAKQTIRESEITARQVQLFRVIRRPCWVTEAGDLRLSRLPFG